MITPIKSWRKNIFIAKRTGVARDNKGNQKPVYATPIAYTMNVQPMTEATRIEMFGANAKKMYSALVRQLDLDISELDVVYLEGNTPENEEVIGANANYVVRRIASPNITTMYYFESIKG